MEQWEKDYLDIIAQDKANKRKAEEAKQAKENKTVSKRFHFNWRKIIVVIFQAFKDYVLILIGFGCSDANGQAGVLTLVVFWLLLKLIQNKLKEVK